MYRRYPQRGSVAEGEPLSIAAFIPSKKISECRRSAEMRHLGSVDLTIEFEPDEVWRGASHKLIIDILSNI